MLSYEAFGEAFLTPLAVYSARVLSKSCLYHYSQLKTSSNDIKRQDGSSLDVHSQDICSQDFRSKDVSRKDISCQNVSSYDVRGQDVSSQYISSMVAKEHLRRSEKQQNPIGLFQQYISPNRRPPTQ